MTWKLNLPASSKGCWTVISGAYATSLRVLSAPCWKMLVCIMNTVWWFAVRWPFISISASFRSKEARPVVPWYFTHFFLSTYSWTLCIPKQYSLHGHGNWRLHLRRYLRFPTPEELKERLFSDLRSHMLLLHLAALLILVPTSKMLEYLARGNEGRTWKQREDI